MRFAGGAPAQLRGLTVMTLSPIPSKCQPQARGAQDRQRMVDVGHCARAVTPGAYQTTDDDAIARDFCRQIYLFPVTAVKRPKLRGVVQDVA